MVPSAAAKRAVDTLRSEFGWTRSAICDAVGISDQAGVFRRDRCTREAADAVIDLVRRERRARRTRLPVEPILAELSARGATTVTAQAAWLGVDGTQIYRWQDRGVPLFTADRLAVKLERHPLAFWPNDFYEEAA
jgi:hypothetical protein